MHDRRRFLKTAAASAAAGFLNLNPAAMGANRKVTGALIGGRNRGRSVALRAIRAGAEFKTVCDLDPGVLGQAGAALAAAQGRRPQFESRFERVLDDLEIDAVVIAVPDHWHARMTLLALQAGKDVYVEAPLCHTIQEGQLIRGAAQRYNRVVQVGVEGRSSDHFRSAAEFAASGKLGKVALIRARVNQKPGGIGRPANAAPPAGVDYDRWLGPAPKRPFDANRFHHRWRYFWDYGSGEVGARGIHALDAGLWAIQLMRGFEGARSLPKRISATGGIYRAGEAREAPETQTVSYDYGDMLLNFELRDFAAPSRGPDSGGAPADFCTACYGTEGTLLLTGDRWEVHWRDGKVETAKATGISHVANFFDCVKSRRPPNCDVETGRLSAMLCHLGNISYKLGRDTHFDPETETFPGDAEANRMLSKRYRKPYDLPKA